jgi:hypothetical protein
MKLKQSSYLYRLYKYSSAISLYLKALKNARRRNFDKNNKIAVVKISNPKTYGRYFYVFIKFLSLSGYTIYIPDVNFKVFRRRFFMSEAQARIYFNLVFEEGLVNFSKPHGASKPSLVFEDGSISFDYFTPFFNKISSSKYLAVPMSMHPLFYHKKLWNQPYNKFNRKKNSVFMVGNFVDEYKQFDGALFGMENRLENISFLKNKGILTEVTSKVDLDEFLASERDKECIVLDKNKIFIKMENLRSVLCEFPFFLAFPGVNIPHCHNIVEAMSVGSIPIIHKNYASLWSPELKHLETAIVYSNLDDLYEILKLVFDLEENIVEKMHLNVLNFYHDNLTPNAVVNKMEKNISYPIFLQAEHYSVACIRPNLFH